METQVLLPPGLSLFVRPGCSSPSLARLLEEKVGVVAEQKVPKGVVFTASHGSVKCGTLEVFSTLTITDPRLQHGCIDEIFEVDKLRRVRRCNWVRFVTVGQPDGFHNVVCRRMPDGHVFFQVEQDILPSQELVVRFPDSTNFARDFPAQLFLANAYLVKNLAEIMSESPLDLSSNLLNQRNMSSSSKSSQPSPNTNTMLEDRTSVSSLDSGLSSSGEDCENGIKSPQPSVAESPILPMVKLDPDLASPERPSSTDTSHSIEQNNNNVKRKIKKKLLPCEYCGKCFDRPSLLKRHLRTHTGERPHVCEVCNKGFSTSSSLNTHKRIHSGEKPHECQTCGKRFTASSNLYYHRMTHVKEKPHKCEICQKSFPTPGDLKSHMYIHNGSWPHRCQICDRGFSKVTNLKNHLFLHTGQKPHECPDCGKKFALGCNMKAHMKTHGISLKG